jgi:hypothetical protein
MTEVSFYVGMVRVLGVWVQVLMEVAWVAFDLGSELSAYPTALD